jgi:hypothetical protein
MGACEGDDEGLQSPVDDAQAEEPADTPKLRDDWTDLEKHRATAMYQQNNETRPYLIDIWKRTPAAPQGTKVFSLRGNEAETASIVSYRRGNWELQLSD